MEENTQMTEADAKEEMAEEKVEEKTEEAG